MAKRMSLLPRWVHHLFALVFGYFWHPCTLCKRRFGGHEFGPRNGNSCTTDVAGRAMGICPDCTRNGAGEYEVWVRENFPTLEAYEAWTHEAFGQ